MVSTGLGCAAGLRRVTEAYGCKLRNGLFADGLVLGVVDTFRACFFLFLLLCVIHGFASAIDSVGFGAWLIEYRYHTELTGEYSTVADAIDGRSAAYRTWYWSRVWPALALG